MSISRLSLPILLALAASCGGSSDPATLKNDAYAAMDSGDSAAAVEKFDAVLAQIDASAPDYIEVAVGRCQALAGVDAAKCATEFLALAESAADKLTDKEYAAVASRLVNEKKYSEAIDLLDKGMKTFNESPKMKTLLDNVIAKSKEAGDDSVTSKLKGLGYLGD